MYAFLVTCDDAFSFRVKPNALHSLLLAAKSILTVTCLSFCFPSYGARLYPTISTQAAHKKPMYSDLHE